MVTPVNYIRRVASVNTLLYGSRSMAERLTAQDWIDFALATFAREGFDALKADVLARKLGISRGSFYWHFTDLGKFHGRLIEHWKRTATEAIIADIERYESSAQRLDALLRHAFGHRGSLEIRMRTWAENNAEAARAVSDIDRRRQEYIEQLLVEAGIGPYLAATRAQVLYWTYLGAALSRSRLRGEQLDQIVAELKQIGLSSVPGKLTSPGHGRQHRSSRR
jgi:AcrR family transcriptional regulator